MKIRELKPRIPVVQDLPQCSKKMNKTDAKNSRGWRQKHYEDRPDIDHTCCVRPAAVELNGKPYCRIHGGSIALAVLLAMEDKG